MSESLAPAVVHLRPFCGVMGVTMPEDGEFRTRPQGPFGGNMDVREVSSGATLYLPVLNLVSEIHTYLLCSVAMNLRLSQVVNEPMYTVSAAMSKAVLPERKLF